MMDTATIERVLSMLQREYHRWKEPIVTRISRRKRDPFRVLVATVISQRTKDEVTGKASERLFGAACTPADMAKLGASRIAELIYPAGFYRNKARHIVELCREITTRFGGKVPGTMEELLSLPGVGRKTANLVLTLGFGEPGICVDTHVHRISNRLGYVHTDTPYETEMVLRGKLPARWWIPYNDLLVTHGQNVCRPVSPRCGECAVERWCRKRGVKGHRKKGKNRA